jgi:Domain of unknown function (DUF4440)
MDSFARTVNGGISCQSDHAREALSPFSNRRLNRPKSRYNLAMPRRLALAPLLICWMLVSACTFNGERPARTFSEATGGEGMERVFWKEVQAANWVQVERSLASNYSGVTASGTLDRSAAIEQYRNWQLKDYALGDLQTELNGTTIVVTYTITLHGTSGGPGGSQPLPTTPQHMMTVWQQQKAGWVAIAHSVSPSQVNQSQSNPSQ